MKYTVRTVQPRRRLYLHKQTTMAIQASLLDVSNEAIFAMDIDGMILYWNKGAQQMYGYSSQEAVGRISHVLLKAAHPNYQEPKADDRAGCREVEHTTKCGRKLDIETYRQTITDEYGQHIILETNRDITDRKEAQRALQKSEQHHRLAAVGAALGTYIYNFETSEDDWSPELYAIWGLQPGERGELDDNQLYRAMHPDDRQTFVEKRTEANDPKGSGVFDVNFRVIRPDGSIRWIHVRGLTTFQGSGEGRRPVFSAGTAMDITEQKMMEERLLAIEKEKIESLEKQIEIKDEFLLTITHEFKTPLSIINSALQTMELACSKDITPKIRKYHDIIRQNSNRQLRLVNNLLDVTRMDAGSLKTYKENIEIVSFTRSISNSIAIFCEQKNIELSFTSKILYRVIGIDTEKYERIVLNLLSNAVKFTLPGQSIAVALSRKSVKEKKMICIEVRDTGVGIPKDKLEVIFEKFGQVGSTRTRQAEGSGIGLHLVKLLVELLGGSIHVESKLGLGSTFTVFFPDQKADDEGKHTAQMAQIKPDTKLIEATALEFSDFYVG